MTSSKGRITCCCLVFKILLMCFNYVDSESSFFGDDEAGIRSWLLRELNGSHLRLTAFSDPPKFNIIHHDNGTISCSGISPSIADYMAKALNITYSFVTISNKESYEIGPKEASVKMLIRNEADVVTRLMIVNLDHCTRMDCSVVFYNEPTHLMVPWPEQESRIFALVRPFDYKVWILFVMSMATVSLTLSWMLKFCSNNIERQDNHLVHHHHQSCWWGFFNGLIIMNHTQIGNNPFWSRWKKFSFKVVLGCWCLAASVLFYAYSTTLISYLVAPKLMPVAQTNEYIVAGYPQNLTLLSEKNEAFSDYCLSAKSGVYKQLGDQLRQNPEALFTDRQKGFDLMFTGRYAYPRTASRIAVYMDMAYKKADRKCKFTISNFRYDSELFVIWTFQKHWRYTEVINQKLQWLRESGLAYFYYRNAFPKVDQCYLENYRTGSSSNQRKILSLADLMGPFIFLILGLALSLLVFLMEKIIFKFHNHST